MSAIAPQQLFALRDLAIAYRDAEFGHLNQTAQELEAAIKPLGWKFGCGIRPDRWAAHYLLCEGGIHIDVG